MDEIAVAPMCPGRQTDPAHQNGNGELVSEPLREMVSERLRSARTVGPNRPGVADEMRRTSSLHVWRLLELSGDRARNGEGHLPCP